MSDLGPITVQATCVAIGGRGLLIAGPPGSGKSTLALHLIDRGAVLVGDDGVLVTAEKGRLVARPHPQTRGLLEVRNIGLVPVPVLDEVGLALRLVLDPAAPRFIEATDWFALLEMDLPSIALWPGGEATALKAELALQRFGLELGPIIGSGRG